MADPWEVAPVVQKPAAASGSDEPWAVAPAVGTQKFKFSDDAIKGAIKNSANVVYMHPDQYLALTPDLESNPRADKKGASLKKSLDKGDEVNEVPSLDVSVGKDGTAKVVDQDGRHRAQFAKDAGVDLIPVAVKRTGEKGLIKSLAGMKDGTEPLPFDFKPVLPPQAPQKAAAAAPKGVPRWDVLGDIGRAAEGAVTATGEDLKKAFPGAKEIAADPGPVATVERMGNALKVPLDAMGVLASPVTGAAHAIGGSAVASGLDHMTVPGHDPKVDADKMIDTAMLGLGPEGMEGGAAGITAAASKAAAAKSASTAAGKTVNALRQTANLKPGAAEAHAAGYVLPPTSALEKPGAVNSLASGVGGKIKLQQGASTRNQEVTNGLAAQSLGLPKNTVLTDKVFQTVRNKASQAYKDIANSVPYMQADPTYKTNIANIGGRNQAASAQFKGVVENPELDKLEENLGKVDMFTPDSALFVVRKLRKDASANLQNRADPNKASLGLAQRKAADEIDDLIERNLTTSGQKDLIPKYKEARKVLARSHDVEGATNTATGDVSAKGLAKLSNRGRPFTGELKTIADAANAFPKALQNAASFGGDEPYSALDAGATAFAAAHGDYGAVATILARPIVRNALLSKTYQDRMIPDLSNLPTIPPPQSGMSLIHNAPLPGVQNQLAKGIFRAAHVNGLRAMMANPQASFAPTPPPPPPQGQQ